MFFKASPKKSFTLFSVTLIAIAFSLCILPETTFAARVNATPVSATIDEDGASQTFEIRLQHPIIAASGDAYVNINFAAVDARLTLSTSSIYFSASQWHEVRELVVSATDDDIENSATPTQITMSVDANSEFYNNFQNTIAITVADDEADSDIDPSIVFEAPTPADDSYQLEEEIEVRLTTSDENDGHYSLVDFDETLIGWWRFEDTATDDSDMSQDSVWSDDGDGEGEDYGAGRFGQAGRFDGHSSLDVVLDAGIDTSFTVSAWVYLDTITESAAIISDENGHLLQIGGSERWQFDNVYDADVTATTSQWVHLVGVYDQAEEIETLYVDGEMAVTGGGTRSIGNVLYVGKRDDGVYIDGKIDEVMIFRRALGASEVASLYDGEANEYEHNFQELERGAYSVMGYVVDGAGRKTATEERVITITNVLPRETSSERSSSSKSGKRRTVEPAPVPAPTSSPLVVSGEVSLGVQTLTEDLQFGMTSPNVTILQDFLMTDGMGPAAQALKANGATNYFGPLTRAALAEWQQVHGIVPAVGYFGPITRALILTIGR